MNRARQDAITTEIMEIVGGAEALAADKGVAEDLIARPPGAPPPFPENLDPRDAPDRRPLTARASTRRPSS